MHGPWVDAAEAMHEYGIRLTESLEAGAYDGVILAVAHDRFRDRGLPALRGHARETHVFCDLKSVFGVQDSDLRL